MSLSKASTMIVRGVFDIGKELVMAQWKYISGHDVQIFSRVNIGDYIDWKYIMLTRLALVSTVFIYKNDIALSIDNVRQHMDNWLSDKLFNARMDKRDNVVGAATMQMVYTFMQHANDVVFILVDTVIAIVNSLVKVASTGIFSLTGYGTPYDVGPLLAATIENMVANNYIPTVGPTGAGILGFAALASVVNFVELRVVGVVAGALEYLANRGVPRISEVNVKLIQDVSRINPMLNRDQNYNDVYPFASSAEGISTVLPSYSSGDRLSFLSSFLFGSELERAVEDARKYFRGIEQRHGRRRRVSKSSVFDLQNNQIVESPTTDEIPTSPTVRRRAKSRGSKKDRPTCVGFYKNGNQCTAKAADGSPCCKRHKSQGEPAERSEFGKKNNLLQHVTLRF